MISINTNPAVSAAVSVYNGEKFIGRCLNSILNQSRAFDEIIVYDDASTDGTTSIVKEYMGRKNGDKIRLIRSDINRGPGGGKNHAGKAVTGEYFTFIDADDYVGETYLEAFLEELKRLPYDPDIIFGGFKKVTEKGEVLYTRLFGSKEEALIGSVQNWGNLYKRSFFETNDIRIPEGKVLDDVLTRGVIMGCAPLVAVSRNSCEYYYVENKSSVSHTYMKSFLPGIIEAEMGYLGSNQSKILPEKKALYEYWAYKTMCWHLLKSGAGVGSKAMKAETVRAFELMKKYFPEYGKNDYIVKKAPSGERTPVRMAVKVMHILEKCNLHRVFLQMYSIINLEAIWPKL